MHEFVYVIQCPESKLIKIGKTTSSNPYHRISSIQTSNPFQLIIHVIVQGTSGLEEHLHQQFAPYRFRGEWFRGECLGLVLDALKFYPRFQPETAREEITFLKNTVANSKPIEKHCCQCGRVLNGDDLVQGPILKTIDFLYVQIDPTRLAYCCNGKKNLSCEKATQASIKAQYQDKWGWDNIESIKDWSVQPV